jgi:hypothetical protein
MSQPELETAPEAGQETALKTERSRLRRSHERGLYDRETVYQVLDAMPLAHIG